MLPLADEVGAADLPSSHRSLRAPQKRVFDTRQRSPAIKRNALEELIGSALSRRCAGQNGHPLKPVLSALPPAAAMVSPCMRRRCIGVASRRRTAAAAPRRRQDRKVGIFDGLALCVLFTM